ncbi:CaiB/BaiF CoA transferase family protein [Thalassotalea piscium]|uniref:Crotonobetainyl-CoA:carnitine CoA-transferase CaiB-like acyl-CoA transferase n=1 Tax=Thalassotalea piscium TaxID=1230533 RepID=A0A7X0NF24_9GAMM|nr:CaiB/BaiF CoA-transferase family protein [Thalassotalea piscium]MBB6542274.1 crotonobetainyl-CoA:carnitine CoA-transferase CaiB-like acyl-CoA transferase [Thalassotalea piscium]
MVSALNNIKVIDLSRILAGPWASQMLADMGAEVIKVERPIKGDDTRFWGPPFVKAATANQPPQAAYFHCVNRNKQSIAIDISKAQGQQVIKDLIMQADVLIENYKVGGLKQYGLDYESVKKLNPQLVYCSITGFGQHGPSANKPGYDAMIQGEGGLMSITGEPEGMPMKVGVALVDVMTGLYCSNAILAALMARHHTNEGQHIDIALLDVQVAALANQGMNYLATGENPDRLGNGHPNIVPYQTFATQNGSIILAVGNDNQFRKFCQVAQCPEIADEPEFATNEQRVINRNTLIPIIAGKLVLHTTQWWVEQLEHVDVPCGPVNTLDQVFNHPQVKHRKMVRQVSNKQGDLIDTVSSPINLSATPLQYHSASPDLGQHSKQVLSQWLNYSDEKITQLYLSSIVS